MARKIKEKQLQTTDKHTDEKMMYGPANNSDATCLHSGPLDDDYDHDGHNNNPDHDDGDDDRNLR